jgi:hypothetical protein
VAGARAKMLAYGFRRDLLTLGIRNLQTLVADGLSGPIERWSRSGRNSIIAVSAMDGWWMSKMAVPNSQS